MMLVWKEWRQQRLLFLFWCLAGLAIPVFEIADHLRHGRGWFTDSGSGILLAVGALFAIILSIATTHHDIRKGVDGFWQSKPICERRLFITKFVFAALVLLVSFLVIISLEVVSKFYHHDRFAWFAWAAFCYTYPVALMVFSVTMFLVVILRDSAKAVLLAIWVALLFYFLPLLVGSLDWMNVFEQMERNQQKSLVESVIWPVLSRIWAPDTGMHRSVTFPATVHSVTLSQYVWSIVSSPEYLQYLKFLAVTIGTAVGCVVLSVVAFKRKWRWQPGQKTIAWTVGLSAAFIFAVSMLQAGHNLVPVKIHNGREVALRPHLFEKPLNEYDWTGETSEEVRIGRASMRPRTAQATCTENNLMYRVSLGFESSREAREWSEPIHQYFMLDVYSFPYEGEAFHLCETRFFRTEPIGRNEEQYVLGCFVRGDRLYVCYRPVSSREPSENPIRFLVVDVSNPQQPRRISDEELSRSDVWRQSMAEYGRYCYVHDGERLLILSLEKPDEPEIVAKMDEHDLQLEGFPQGSWQPNQMSVVEDKLVCNSYSSVAIFDLSEAAKPRLICSEGMQRQLAGKTKDRFGAAVYSEGILYLTAESGLYVFEFTADKDGMLSGELIGRRRATPIEKLAGRSRPNHFVLTDGMLIEAAGRFGLLVYDVSDPSHPKRAYHGETGNLTTDIGLWEGLVYMVDFGERLYIFEIPRSR